MVNINMTHEFKHPKYYKELRKRNKSDQVISDEASTEATSVHPGPGLNHQASSTSAKLQAPSIKLSNQPVQSPSDKHPSQSNKRQASSPELQAPLSENHGTWILEKF
jgi:sortase (surface protein transpeptidase)